MYFFKFQKVQLVLIGFLVGAALSIGLERLYWATSPSNKKFMDENKNEALKRCISVADLIEVKEQNLAQRALRITDCMAANGFLFTGAKPESHCYAEHPIQMQVKHILPSCYEAR
jgi:hypothetical protein